MGRPSLMQRLGAEGMGTFGLVFGGCGAIMVADRIPGSVPALAIPLAFALALGVMILSMGHLSGGHFNPAVTLGLTCIGQHPRRELLPYVLAQVAGSIAAITVLALLLPAGTSYGATVPHVGPWQALGWEVVLTFALVFVVVSVATDNRAPGVLAGIAIGATLCVDALVGGPVTGASMNPARSIGPALWEGHLEVLWIYIVGPAAGGVAAALTYQRLR
jgi:MIP family channel proteins